MLSHDNPAWLVSLIPIMWMQTSEQQNIVPAPQPSLWAFATSRHLRVLGTNSGKEIGLSHSRTHCELVWAFVSVIELLPKISEETLGSINSMRIVW